MSSRPAPLPPRLVFNSKQIAQGIQRLAQGILAVYPDPSKLGLVGVHSGGDTLVRRVEENMATLSGRKSLDLDKGLVEISFYRDDFSRLSQIPKLRATDIPFSVESRHIILIDDVIFTGRTTRAALGAIFSQGRPDRVLLAVLVDRGHRELPLEPDVTGFRLPTERHQSVNVYIHKEPTLDHAILEDRKYTL